MCRLLSSLCVYVVLCVWVFVSVCVSREQIYLMLSYTVATSVRQMQIMP